MANPRQEEPSTRVQQGKSAEEAVRRTEERTTEQTRRIGLAAAHAGEEIARVSAHMFQENAEMAQNTWRFGVDMATAMVGRSSDQLGRALGLSGDEAQQATERSARNAETILQSASAVTKGMNGISRECFELARRQFQNNMERMNELWRCRTPQDLAAVQTDLMREAFTGMLESGRRMADMSVRLADDAGKQMAQSMQRAA
jgi:phasin family protein